MCLLTWFQGVFCNKPHFCGGQNSHSLQHSLRQGPGSQGGPTDLLVVVLHSTWAHAWQHTDWRTCCNVYALHCPGLGRETGLSRDKSEPVGNTSLNAVLPFAGPASSSTYTAILTLLCYNFCLLVSRAMEGRRWKEKEGGRGRRKGRGRGGSSQSSAFSSDQRGTQTTPLYKSPSGLGRA